MFVTILTADLDRTMSWYVEGLGFINLFTVARPDGPALVHFRRWQFQDLLARSVRGRITAGNGVHVSFAAVYDELDELVARARSHGAGQVEGPADSPWNTRDVKTVDSDGNVIIFTAVRPTEHTDPAFSHRIRAQQDLVAEHDVRGLEIVEPKTARSRRLVVHSELGTQSLRRHRRHKARHGSVVATRGRTTNSCSRTASEGRSIRNTC